MTLDNLREIVRKITYKPGHRIDLEVKFEGVFLVLEFPVLDACSSDLKQTKIRTLRALTKEQVAEWDSNHALEYIFMEVVNMETHEVQEWLKHRGLHIVHPHPEQLESFQSVAQERKARRAALVKEGIRLKWLPSWWR